MVITTKEDPVVSEVTTTLREWHQIWISLYLDNQYELFERIGNLILNLIDSRSELLTLLKPTATFQDSLNREQQLIALKTDIVSKLDLGNNLLGLDLILRDSIFRPVDPIELSPVKLYQLHLDASRSQSIFNKSSAPSGSQGYQDSTSSTTGSSLYTLSQTGSDCAVSASSQNQCSHHLQLALKKYYFHSLPSDELIEIYFSIVEMSINNSQVLPLTDKFLVQIKKDELVCGFPNTIFANLGPVANRDIGILIQVYRIGKMILTEGGYKTTFGKQQSSSNMAHSLSSDISNGSYVAGTIKQNINGPARNRHSTISSYFSIQANYRRPFGVTYVPLRDRIRNSFYKETDIPLRIASSTCEMDFSQLNDIYPKKSQVKISHNTPNIQLEISVKYLSCAQESIPRLSTLKSYCVTEKRGYPDIVMPGDFKNDLYFTLEGAEFEKGGKSISKNIEASISLIDKSGLVISSCIAPASNCDKLSNYNSCVYYHSNSPRWNECIKINVPLAEFDGAHVRIEFKHCSTKDREKKFLGFSFLPLSDDDGTVIADRSHDLYLYKCDSQMWEGEPLSLCKYISLPYGPSAKSQSLTAKSASGQNFTHSNREIVTVSTFLLSTKLTQNSNLLNLLKWRELIKRNNNEFGEVLKKVLVLKGEEIVKFLQDILDTLFDTFTLYTLYPHHYSTSEYDYSALIFKVLVHIFLLLDEPKYQHFKPVLDTYASAHFSATLVYKGLLACLKECLEHSSVVERHGRIQSCLKSIKYIFLFIVQSKLLYSKATGEQNDKLFIKDLKQLFKLFETILAGTNPKLIPIQETLLQTFPGTIEQLLKVLSAQELVEVVTSLCGSVGWHLPVPLARAKLIFMRETTNTSLIKNLDARIRIADNFCRHLDCYLRNLEELEVCHEVLETLVVKIHDYHWPSIYRLYQLTLKTQPKASNPVGPMITVGEINAYAKVGQISMNQLDLALINVARELEPIVNLMEPLLQLLDMLVQDFNGDGPLIQKYCTCLLTTLKLMGKVSFEQFMKRRQLDYLKLCNLFKSLRGVYDPHWSIMQLTSFAILEHPIDEISKELLRSENNPVNRQLGSYINLIVDFIIHPTLQLEAFSERKRTYVLCVFNDLRLKFISQLLRFWKGLTSANICDLIPISIQSFLDAALLPNDELQKKLIPFFWDIIDAEDKFKSNLRQIERCLIDNLDLFMNLDRGNQEFIENFDQILKNIIKERSPTWEQKGLKLINSFAKLMQLLINYRQSFESYENRSKQMTCLVDLLNFYKDQDRMDIYLKYLFKLCDMHLEAGSYTEAAFTLKLYADDMRWCNRCLGPLDEFKGLKFPEEQEWCRKEKLYHKIIHFFDMGKCWEESIGLCKELASFYENFLVDYEKVSSILKRLAQFLDYILTEHRPEREYFRVEFIGSDLPEFVRGKELIYRGGEYERLATFIQRITSEFPDARVLNSKSKQSLQKDCHGQHMVISNVKPVPFLQEHFKSGQRAINDKIIQYYLNNRLDTFSYDLPIVKGSCSKQEKSGEVNFKNLWVGRYMLKIRKQLPDILPWNEVISHEYIEISPINNAIETISSMNLEMSKLILSYTKEPNKPISPLTMRLQGIIEAAVNGGPSVIVNAFFRRPNNSVQDKEASNSMDHESLIKLRDLFKQQYSILETGLALHSKLAPPEVMPLHERLVERLPRIRETLLEDTNQQIENTYEVLDHCKPVIDQPMSGEPTAAVVATTSSVQPPPLPQGPAKLASANSVAHQSKGALNEIEGGHQQDLNGNLFSDQVANEDHGIYSQPQHEHCNPSAAANMAGKSSETKSEFSSPSRNITTNNNSIHSSSPSMLAILSNLPLNRSRISLTPSKEITEAYLARDQANSATNDSCLKASRRLTYDSSRVSADLGKSSQQQLDLLQAARVAQSLLASSSLIANESAPPLPPKSFLKDKHHHQRLS